MNAIFHRAKHWHLFVLLVGSIAIFQISIMLHMSSVFTDAIDNGKPPEISKIFWFFIPMMLIFLAIVSGWQWSIGWGLKDKLPVQVKMNFKRFKLFMIIPIVYLIFYMLFVVGFVTTMENLAGSSNPDMAMQSLAPYLIGMLVIFPIHLFALFCMGYNFYFCAKLLKSIEMGREAELGDYIGYFFLFWFNVIGFWIIQPSVNRISSGDWTPPRTPPPGMNLIHPSSPTIDPPPPKVSVPPGERLKTRDHKAFEHDDDFEGLF